MGVFDPNMNFPPVGIPEESTDNGGFFGWLGGLGIGGDGGVQAGQDIDVGSIGGVLSSNPIGMLGAQAFSMLGIDFQAELSNVFNYGFSSWGASTTPEGIGVHLSKFEQDIQVMYSELFNGDFNHNLNELSKFLWWGYQFYDRMRADHAQARSTKEAYDMAKGFFKKQQNDVWLLFIAKLTQGGYVISKDRERTQVNQYLHLGAPVEQDDPPVYYWHFTIDVDKLTSDLSNPVSSTGGSGVGTKPKFKLTKSISEVAQMASVPLILGLLLFVPLWNGLQNLRNKKKFSDNILRLE